MIKTIVIAATLLSCTASVNNNMAKTDTTSTMENTIPTSIHTFKVTALDGGSIDFSTFKGKKILVVNTASECGYTRQYEGLQKLFEAQKDKLVIVGFPANNFGGQEPGSNTEIGEFCIKQLFINGFATKLKMACLMQKWVGILVNFC
jgi:hypothetical protein